MFKKPIQEFNFEKTEKSLEKRKLEYLKITTKYSNRIPVLVEKLNSSNIELLSKSKYLIPKNFTIGEFMYVIRTSIKLPPEKALFLFVNNHIPPTSDTIDVVYAKHKSSDGFLRILYSDENTFGHI